MSTSKKRTVLAIIATDRTFSKTGGQWRGKCIHCRSWLVIDADGTPRSQATIEHIVPKSRGGGDTLENLALACARCNHEKGKRHDHQPRGNSRLEHVIRRLSAEREKRWRPPQPASP